MFMKIQVLVQRMFKIIICQKINKDDLPTIIPNDPDVNGYKSDDDYEEDGVIFTPLDAPIQKR